MSTCLIRGILESLPVIFSVSVLVFLLGERAAEAHIAAIRARPPNGSYIQS